MVDEGLSTDEEIKILLVLINFIIAAILIFFL